MPSPIRRFAHLVYGSFFTLAFATILSPTLVLLAITPGLSRRRRLAKYCAAAVFWTGGCPITVRGRHKLRNNGVVVANHSSYLDGVILTAALPANFTFVIKKEMNQVPLAGWLLRRLGSEFVDRENPHQRTRDARRLVRHAQAQRPLVFFPEGTFDGETGLKRFRPGAFRAAHRAGLPLMPIAIQGARQKLPAGRWLPRPGALTVQINDALDSREFPDASSLSHEARRAILDLIGEPDLAQAGRKP